MGAALTCCTISKTSTSLHFIAHLHAGQIWLDNVDCGFSDEVLEDCTFRPWGQHNCDHGDDVGVICRPGECNIYLS